MKIDRYNDLVVQRVENGFIVAPRTDGTRFFDIGEMQVAETVGKLTSILARWGSAQEKTTAAKSK
jgi:hypothetical protein